MVRSIKYPVPVLRLAQREEFVYHLTESRIIELSINQMHIIDPRSSFDMEKSSYGLYRKIVAARRALFFNGK